MAIYTVRQGRRYRAMLTLGVLERLAGNDIIAQRLSAAGFDEVSVEGAGANRVAIALWPNADATAELPAQIKAVTEIE